MKTEKETQMYRIDFWTLWEKARVWCSETTALKHVYYQGWNRSPAQVWCMRQVLRAGALGRPRGMRWGGRWEGGLGWETHVNPWQIHVNVWQKPLQYYKVISLQLIKINEKKFKKKREKKFLLFSIHFLRTHYLLCIALGVKSYRPPSFHTEKITVKYTAGGCHKEQIKAC